MKRALMKRQQRACQLLIAVFSVGLFNGVTIVGEEACTLDISALVGACNVVRSNTKQPKCASGIFMIC